MESVAAQPEIDEVIVVDDQSTDRTPEILSALAARIPKLKVLHAGDLPPGWAGKNHAVWLGAQAARGDWLLFTDADTFHLPQSASRALSDAHRHSAALVSYSPEQDLGSFWERAVIPVVYWRLSQRFSFDRVNDPRAPDAAANGQYLLIRRDAYQALGGHQAIAAEILEDVALARLAKQSGYRLYFASGAGIVRTRMYQSLTAMWQGWTKNLYPLFAGHPAHPADAALELDAASPWLGLLLALAAGAELLRGRIDWILAVIAVILFARPWAWYELWLRRNRHPAVYAAYYLPGICFYSAAMIASWWKNTRGVVTWKGRAYSRPRS